ncbi:amino acid/amide ABC transporter substrate-binding protein, HAAT family [Halobiforma haloterrestris]|uniref:Amino acid/amide ABC transporter substrate-binding protein, HAAT family n=1 Tax=Natronobacterium haloterrestre TaxID=148448 RepID=A0A1I1H4B1_NATHA|nr:ABC transporter substrate-binding protein [Halobiforma haloterrestris]SFC18857.1 amino acid/amide ABC transporter substrate-binding protein, HAAT family [Halobiforma haloterrestris]
MPGNINRRTYVKGLGATGTAGLLAGCIGEEEDVIEESEDGDDEDEDAEAAGTDPDEREVMLGILQPETGDLGELGTPIADAAELPALQLENEGSPVTVAVQREDTQTESEAGISRAEDLVAAGVPSFTGAAASDVTIPVAESVAIPEQVVMCSPASTSPLITDLDGDYVFRTAPSDALQGQVMAEVAFEERGWESAASFHLNDDYGQALSEVFVDSFEELGGEVTNEVAFEPEQPSYTSGLEDVLSDEPDVLIVIAFPVSGIQIFRDFYGEFSDELPIMVTDGLIEDGLPEDVDNPMDNVMGTAPAADGPEADAFAELYEEEYGSGPGVFNAHAYDASAVQILANLRAGENDGDAISSQMREVANPGGEVVGPSNFAEGVELAADGAEVEYQGASSTVDFDENGDMESVSYDIFEFGDFEIEAVERIEFEA